MVIRVIEMLDVYKLNEDVNDRNNFGKLIFEVIKFVF